MKALGKAYFFHHRGGQTIERSEREWNSLSDHLQNRWAESAHSLFKDLNSAWNSKPEMDEQTDDSSGIPTEDQNA